MTMRRSPGRGFTLIEVLVAISIFAVVAAGVYRVLSAMVETQSSIVAHSDSLRDMQRALWMISMDMNHLVMRDVREPNDDRSPALIADDDGYLLKFTRQGLRNPLLVNRSDLERVSYSLGSEPYNGNDKDRKRDKSSQHLLRHTWGAVDRKDESVETIQVLFRDVEEVDFEFLDEKGDWKKDWPEKKNDDKLHARILPEAIKLTLKTKKYGAIERIYQTGNVIHKKKIGREKGAS
jgi:general secretion pathway protein J